MAFLKKYFYFIIGFILLIVVLNFGINFWIENKLPQLINQENKSDYSIAYEDLHISLWNTSIEVVNITLVPRVLLENTDKKIGIYATVERIEVASFNIWSILFGDKIKAERLVVSKPVITLYKNDTEVISNSKSIHDKVIRPFQKIIMVSDIYLDDGKIEVIENKNQKKIASATAINLKLEGIKIDDETLKQKIPFTFEKYSFVCDSLFYQMNEFYNVKSAKLSATEKGIQVENFDLRPRVSRHQFVKRIPLEKDLYTILVEDININAMDWGFKEDDFYFNSNSVVINDLNANIYRGKMPEDDLSKKKLYNRLLRELKFNLKVDTLKINKSKLVYEEEKDFEAGPGKISFTNFNMTVLNIQSGFKKQKLDDTKIVVKCIFMKESALNVDWSFNVLDKTDGFKIKGAILNFNTEEMAYFTKPYINVIVKGNLDKVYFNFAGNDLGNKGDFALKYDDLKVEIYQKNDRKKVNKFLSAIGNLFVKDDSGEELKSVAVAVDRTQEKSFYNLLWISIADGLKKILI